MKLQLGVIILFIGFSVQAQTVRVAVAANAQFVLQKLKADFEHKTGVTVEIISGSSGKLSSQIQSGAPYDVFLSADMEFTELIYNRGFALSKPREYATGSLIVCSASGADVRNWKKIVSTATIVKFAVANPKTAPYGKAAEEALNHFKLYKAISGQLVFGESINQVNTYIVKKVVELGFTTESLVYEMPEGTQLKWLRIDKSAYKPIRQGCVLLKHAKSGSYLNSRKFYDYLFSPAAKSIFKQYGYGV
ncbi:molybdate ABC transporter substrate-binding protein [Pedobacter sp. MC2016-14]|uniref:molybdate ABC transporter substrate-binding protein n=1 Tax=Pedobacter sp. MC2016-14 TaxID=2897327 RepID=UPI001E31307D|nr:molybdate ABC transporter substrate-binding protein [Pedobacter sp. MC2016-14]MCD0490173.1 molybdate ABC transporter substrate-binding protein [Pedobacter sp. MC2016-14]